MSIVILQLPDVKRISVFTIVTKISFSFIGAIKQILQPSHEAARIHPERSSIINVWAAFLVEKLLA
jgi:hypothetical protein